jgi:solute:Na+ symporter, SSS family
MNWSILGVFIALFLFVTVLGFWAANWRKADLNHLDEWGLGGRNFGTIITWFLLGGDLYTAYTFIAVPGMMYGKGALGFFAVPYTIMIYPFIFVVMPRLWAVSKKHGYITASDFIKGRYGSSSLSTVVAVTGILATMPYIALQLVGMQAVIQAMGVSGELPLIIAFAILAAYTYTSGLRAPAVTAVVKDLLIYATIIVAAIVIPMKVGGYGHIFQASSDALKGATLLKPSSFMAYATLSVGSALALFLYPHSLTGVLSSKSGAVIKRNAALLPLYTLALGVIALLGYMAIAAGIHTKDTSMAVPLLFLKEFPGWFTGVAFAAIAIGALVPASIMSIAAANLFTRNIYKEYLKPGCTPAQEAKIAKISSLVVKVGALFFILGMQRSFAINLQLLGGIWILQTFPALIIGIYSAWFNRYALIGGWGVGMITGTYMAYAQNWSSVFPLHIGSTSVGGYAAVWALLLNFIVAIVLTWVFNALKLGSNHDETKPEDYRQAA